jgi:hypothetical protein
MHRVLTLLVKGLECAREDPRPATAICRYEVYVDRAWLVFRPINAYVAGPGNKTTRLIAAGSCNVVTTDYPDVNSLYK